MLLPDDYICIGIVAKHCDNSKLCVAERQALDFDLSSLFCDFWNEIIEYWNEVDAYDLAVKNCNGDASCISLIPVVQDYQDKKSLIYGGVFQNCSGKNRNFEGVKKIAVLYAYSRYVILNGWNDTPTGFVTKENEFSIPKTLKELESFADRYRTMGYEIFKRAEMFLCNKKEIFTDFNSKNCVGCGCSCEKCGNVTLAKGYGIRGNNITKRL